MPNKDFKQDLKDAKTPDRYPNLSNIKSGEYDFSMAFTFNSPNGHKIDIDAIVSDTTNYPKAHSLLVITASENEVVQKVLELEAPHFKSATLHEVLTTVDRILFDALVHNTITRQEGDVLDGAEEDDFEYNSSFYGPSNDFNHKLAQKTIRRDLRAAKAAGFRIGYYSKARGVQQGATLLSISCRISRLKISNEVMQSWNVNRDEYLVLLLLYPSQYHDMDRILDLHANGYRDSIVQMRVGLCDAYKPTLEHAEQAFKTERACQSDWRDLLLSEEQGKPLKHLFIGTSLNKLLNCRLVSIIRFRIKYNVTWTAAEMYYNSMISKTSLDDGESEQPPNVADTWDVPAPPPLAFDHFPSTQKELAQASFPLVAMQFTLRHLVKCNSFCAVCHCKISNELDAVKPFVCSNQLCLYQYMSLNMGFSINHEVLSQPKVVDLLVSLAYHRTRAGALTDFPTGQELRVPVTDPESNPGTIVLHKTSSKRELEGVDLQFSVGDWLMIYNHGASTSVHCRVESIDSSCTHAQLSPFIYDGPKKELKFSTPVCVLTYKKPFDELEPPDKFNTILTLLNTLPPIDEMKCYLKASSSHSLSNWTDRISPTAFSLFRWIVATNRSCILLDEDPKNLVSDMPNWRQFRIIGTPEKEVAFAENVRAHGKKLYPTLFAWHGSATSNWHAILREGLNFNVVRNGRSYGDGVYFSSDALVSIGYSAYHATYQELACLTRSVRPNTWISSDSNGAVLTLNEIVNAPEKFVSTSPHLVVNHIDWIQPRYLFLLMTQTQTTPDPSLQIYNQDPARLALGSQRVAIQIPLSAIPLSRQKDLSTSNVSPKKEKPVKKAKIRNPSNGQNVIIDTESIASDDEDRMILLSDDEGGNTREIVDLTLSSDEELDVKSFVPETKDGWVPGTLRDKRLSLMECPKFATPVATRLLQKQLQATLKVQNKGNLHELGWYIDPELITTPYQWIVELHSFDPDLPLAQDMKNAGIKSIILEIRFPDSYPMNPPFVRIVTPKFLEFIKGGGGHVTSGGSMCLELLTSSGWLPSFSMESVLIQVRMALCDMEPRPARLRKDSFFPYQISGAIAGYHRFAKAHKWSIPDLSWVRQMK